jgi:hypothetical protein
MLSAGSPARSAMGRGAGFWKILAWAGLLLAGALYMVDPVKLFASSVAPICFVAADSYEPDSLMEIRVNGARAHHDGSVTNDEDGDRLFGMETPAAGVQLLPPAFAGICRDLDCFTRINAPCRIPVCFTEAESFAGAWRPGPPLPGPPHAGLARGRSFSSRGSAAPSVGAGRRQS